MATKRKRVFGTTSQAISDAEEQLGLEFSPSFRAWLLENNGSNLGDIPVFPVFDERDLKTTWDSIVRRYDQGRWFPEYFVDEGLTGSHLLPFASLEADCYCFDYNYPNEEHEIPVVWWSHETDETQRRAASFAEFARKIKESAFSD